MKKLLIIFSCILMMFAIVACNQSGPDVKPDAFEEANQAIPSSNVGMENAPDVTEDQTVAFNADFANAKTQVMSGIAGVVMGSTSSDGQIDWSKVLNYCLGGVASKTLDDGSGASDIDPTVKVDIDSMSGVLSLTCNELVLEGSEIDESNNTVVVTHVLSDISVNATLSGKTISVVVKGKLDGTDFEITGTVTIDTYATDEGKQIVVDFPEADHAVLEELKNITMSGDYSLVSSKEITLTLTNVGAKLSVAVKGVATKIPVGVSLNGGIVLSIATNEKNELTSVSVTVNSLTAKVDAGVLGNVSASVRNLSFSLAEGLSISLSVSEVSLCGTLLPNADKIMLKAGMKGFEFDSTGVIAIDSMEATVLGYENISVAAKVEDFSVDISAAAVNPSFKFGAAVSFENQTIGVRGELDELKPINPIITTLNGSPVTNESLIALVSNAINPSTDGEGSRI